MADRLPGAQLDRLFDALRGIHPAVGEDERRAARATYAMLLAGQPVTAAALAAAVGWDPSRAQRHLDALPAIESNDQGAVVGLGGLTLRPTPHRVAIRGQVRYAWCAWDTLFLPLAFGTDVEVASHCPQTDRPVQLKVAPAGVVERSPAGVVVSFVEPGAIDATDLRGTFCGAVHFLADAAAAARWTARPPGALVIDLDDAFELGRRMMLERCGPC